MSAPRLRGLSTRTTLGLLALLASAALLTWFVTLAGAPWYAALALVLTGFVLLAQAYAIRTLRRVSGRQARLGTLLTRHERRESRDRHVGVAVQQLAAKANEQLTGLLGTAAQDRAETVLAVEHAVALSGEQHAESVRQTAEVAARLQEQTVELAARLQEQTVELAAQLKDLSYDLRHRLEHLDSTSVTSIESQRSAKNGFAQVEALLDLRSLLSPRLSMLPSGGWAAAATTLLAVVDSILETRPELVVECGSGTSSVWIGYALERLGAGRCVSLEHDEFYAAQSRAELRRHGLEHRVEVRLAPLTPVQLGEDTYSWYDPAQIEDIEDIGVVLVDGPPGATGPHARFPALPMLAKRCRPDGVFILDDASRPEEAEVIEAWRRDCGAVSVRESSAEKGWHRLALPGA